MKLKVFCYSGCGTCRKALKYLDAKGVTYTLLPIRETPPSRAELKKMLKYLDGDVKKLFNTSSKDYREGGFREKLSEMTPDAIFDALIANGNLVKRPFVLGNDFGLVGFRQEIWDVVFQAG
jgi:arsenate reductase (glutaredoxin)